MEWLRDTFYPPSKPDTWMDYLQHVLKTSLESTLALRGAAIEWIKAYIIPVLYLAMEQFKVALQILMDNFHKHFVPFAFYLVERLQVYCETFGFYLHECSVNLYENTLNIGNDITQYLKQYTAIILTNCIYFSEKSWDQLCSWTAFVYNYFSLFPAYKLYSLAVILVLMLCCLAMLVYTCRKHKQATRNIAKVIFEDKNGSLTSVDSDYDLANGDCNKVTHRRRSVLWTIQLFIITVCVTGFLVSIPWEFIRLYQNELARKASITIAGMPDSCLPRQHLTTWQSLKGWFMWQLSWSHDPCEQYHRALLVDPFWEVTPMMVLSSSFTKCVTVPLETISTGVGRSVRNLFSEIPVTWQPVVMVTLVMLLVAGLVMFCSYKLSLPLLLKLEPSQRTPVIFRACRQVRKSRKHKHKKHRKDKYYYESDNSFENSY